MQVYIVLVLSVFFKRLVGWHSQIWKPIWGSPMSGPMRPTAELAYVRKVHVLRTWLDNVTAVK